MIKEDKETYALTTLLAALFVFMCCMWHSCHTNSNEMNVQKACLHKGHTPIQCGMEAN